MLASAPTEEDDLHKDNCNGYFTVPHAPDNTTAPYHTGPGKTKQGWGGGGRGDQDQGLRPWIMDLPVYQNIQYTYHLSTYPPKPYLPTYIHTCMCVYMNVYMYV